MYVDVEIRRRFKSWLKLQIQVKIVFMNVEKIYTRNKKQTRRAKKKTTATYML